MKGKLVYDFPTRAFHWIFAFLFIAAFVIAKACDDESSLYPYHMMAGLTLSFAVCLRFIWGLLGTRWARFDSFPLQLKDLVSYLKGVVTGEKKRWAGHNPASSWAAIIMMSLALCMAVTGVLMASGANKETFEDIHELLANSFFIVAVVHVMGIVIHTLRFKELIGLSMITGRKEDVSEDDSIAVPRFGFGIIFIALVFGFAVHLLKSYDSDARKLNLFGVSLQLGSPEGEAQNERD